MTFEEHEARIHAAKSALNDAIHDAAKDMIKVKYDDWSTIIHNVDTHLVGRVAMTKVVL